MKQTAFILMAVLLYLSHPLQSWADVRTAGFIQSLTGDVKVVFDTTTRKAAENMIINVGDTIVTGGESSIGIVFEDDSVVSLGPNSKMEVRDFHFDPAADNLSFIAKVLKGTFSYLSGKITKLAPQKVKIETPDATLGIRGTKLVVEVK